MSAVPAVIVVHWGPWQPTRRLVDQLLADPDPGFEVVAFCNETVTGAPEARALRASSGCTLLCSSQNLGYAGAVNAAIEALGPRPAYLVANNDIRCPPAVARDLLAQARAPHVGAVGPVTLGQDGEIETAGVDVDFNSPYVVEHRLLPPPDEPRFSACRSIQGSTFAFSSEAHALAGRWDERFFYAWEETDWCLRLEALGRTNGILADTRVHHASSASLGGPAGYNPIVEYMLIRNLLYFVQRWSPASLAEKLAFWTREAERTSTVNPGCPPPDPRLARRVVEGALGAFAAGETGRWPEWLEALRPPAL